MSRLDETTEQLKATPRRWLVTGVAGFIGSHLLEALLDLDQDVVGLDDFSHGHRGNIEDAVARGKRGSFHLIEGDIRDAATCARAVQGVDVVLHQAALGSVPRSIEDPALYHAVNVDGFVNMALAAKDAGAGRFVYASSSAVYGDHPTLPKHEHLIGEAVSPYGLTKRADELYAMMFARVYGLESVGLRYFNVFGRRQDPLSAYAAVIPHWIARLLGGDHCVINGDGETTRDFCFIDNVVQANLLAGTVALEDEDQVYNVGVGERTSLNQLYALLRDGLVAYRPEVAGRTAIHQDFRPGDVRHSQADTSKIRSALGFEPTHDLARGIEQTLEWYVEKFTPAVHAKAV
jgi:UDP-N-acetylglucosamine 4-epimerase